MTVMGEWQKKKMLSKSQAVPVAPITTGHRFFGCPRSQAGLERTSLKLVSDHTFLDLRWHETAPQHSAVLPWPFFFSFFTSWLIHWGVHFNDCCSQENPASCFSLSGPNSPLTFI